MSNLYGKSMTYEVILKNLLYHVPDTVDKREGSVIYDALSPVAAEMAKMYIELDVIMDETFVDTASMQYLMKRCKERGVEIKSASAATIQAAFTPDTIALTTAHRFNCDNQNYVVSEKVSNGIYNLKAETVGTAGNLYSGKLLPIQYIDGLQTAEIVTVLIPGEDGDDTDSLRKRYYDSLSSLAFGGNIADYKSKVSLLEGVGGVKVTPIWNGGGTVKLTIISSDFKVPSDELIESVQTAVDPTHNEGEGLGIAPIGHVVTVVGAVTNDISVSTSLTFSDGWMLDDAREILENAINEYFEDLAADWDREDAMVIRIAQIENRLFDLPCVLDIADTKLNGIAQNVQLEFNEIPTLGSLEVL